MDNIELEKRIKEIISEKNYFEMVMKVQAFEPDYKKSDFFKITKKPLKEVIKEAKFYYALQLEDLSKNLQEMINTLSFENIGTLLDKIGDTFQTENEDLKETLEVFKSLK